MTDTIYRPYVVMVRDHRVDAAGPFKDIHTAASWAEQWQAWTDDPLRDAVVAALGLIGEAGALRIGRKTLPISRATGTTEEAGQ